MLIDFMKQNTFPLTRRTTLACIAAGLANAQNASTARKTFEVVSIKPGDPSSHAVRIQIAPGGRFVCENVNVRFLIEQALGVRQFQISGGPSWMGTERFDVNAKADGTGQIGRDELKPMILSLLEDRFKMKFHRETKEFPIYALVSGKGGAKMKVAETQGQESRGMIRMGRGQVNGTQMDMAMLANNLSNQLGRQVIDKTGLTEKYDFELNWTPDESQAGFGPFGGPPAPPPPPSDTPGPSIFTALQEQLGLKLESQKGPVPMIVVDSIEKPTEN